MRQYPSARSLPVTHRCLGIFHRGRRSGGLVRDPPQAPPLPTLPGTSHRRRDSVPVNDKGLGVRAEALIFSACAGFP